MSSQASKDDYKSKFKFKQLWIYIYICKYIHIYLDGGQWHFKSIICLFGIFGFYNYSVQLPGPTIMAYKYPWKQGPRLRSALPISHQLDPSLSDPSEWLLHDLHELKTMTWNSTPKATAKPRGVAAGMILVKSSPIHLPKQSPDLIWISVLLNSTISQRSFKKVPWKNVAKDNAKAPYSPSTLIMREGTGIASSAGTSALCWAKMPPGTDVEPPKGWQCLDESFERSGGNTFENNPSETSRKCVTTYTIYYSRHNFRGVVSQKAWPT